MSNFIFKKPGTLYSGLLLAAFLLLPSGNALAQTVYVANECNADTQNQPPCGSVSVINIATRTVTATIPAGNFPYYLAITPDGSKLYVPNETKLDQSNEVSVISTVLDKVIANIPTQLEGYGVAINAAGTKAYVTASANGGGDASALVVDLGTGKVIDTISFGNLFGSEFIALTPDGTKGYATAGSSQGAVLEIFNTVTDKVTKTINFDYIGKLAIARTPSGNRAYLPVGNSAVTVMDTDNDSVVATIQLAAGDDPYAAAVNPAGTMAYVISSQAATLSVINTATNTVVATVQLPDIYLNDVAVSWDGTQVYITKDRGFDNHSDVYIVDTATNKLTGTVQFSGNSNYPSNAYGIVVQPIPTNTASSSR